MLTGHEITSGPNQEPDHVRFSVRFDFSNGKSVLRRSIRVASMSDVAAKVTALEASAIREAKKKAAGKLVEKDDEIAESGEATAGDVLKAYLHKALYERDMLAAFRLFKRIRVYVQSEGYSWDQVRNYSGMRGKDRDRLKAQFDFFQTNAPAINRFLGCRS